MKYIVDEENIKKRLDMYLTSVQSSMTRSYIKTLIESGDILVNGKNTKAGYILKMNDNITITDNIKKEDINVIAEDIKLDIIYEDKDIIIVNKEKGMVVHPANGNYTGTVVNSLMYSHKSELSTINGIVRPGIVHRIDKDTSGIIVIAKNDNAHKKLSNQFKVHSITRKYVALVKGIVKEDDFSINLPIGRSTKDRKKMAVMYKNSKNAITHIKVIKRYYNSKITKIEATLETGRTHQIRVHMSYMGYPLLGDSVYGNAKNIFGVSGQVLHAQVLGIVHPTSGRYMEFCVEPPQEFKKIEEILLGEMS